MILTVILVRGIRESARTNNIMVLRQDRRHPGLHLCRRQLHQAPLLASLHAQRLDRRAHRRLHHLLHLHRLRFRLHRRRGVQAIRSATCPSAFSPRWLPARCSTAASPSCLSGIVPWQSVMGDAAPVVNALKKLSLLPGGAGLHWVRLFVLIGALMGMISSILVFQLGQARVWFAMSRDGLLPTVFTTPPQSSAPPPSPPGSLDSSSAFPPACSTSAPSPTSPTSAPSSPSCWSPSASSSCAIASRSAPRLPRPAGTAVSRPQHHLLHRAHDGP